MVEYKVNFGDPKTGKTKKVVISGDQANAFMHKKIGDKIKGDDIGFAGYEFEISGGSDYCGFPMRKDVDGTSRKKILIVSGIGIRKNKPGRKVRKTVAAKDFPDPLPPVIIKYLASDENKGLYFLFSISFNKCYNRHIDSFIT